MDTFKAGFKSDFKTNARVRESFKFERLVAVLKEDPALKLGELQERFSVGPRMVSRARAQARKLAA